MPIQCHPAYHEGFYDAQDLTPLFEDASPEYRAGWLAFWNCWRLAESMGGCNIS